MKEAERLGIPVFAIVDTNSDPSNIDFVIPANDDATKSLDLIVEFVTNAIKEGLDERKIERADAAAAEEQDEEAPQRRERKSKAAKKERVKKEDTEAMKAAVVSKFTKDEEVDE